MGIKAVITTNWLRLTDKNGSFPIGKKPGYYWIYIIWVVTGTAFYLLKLLGVVGIIVAFGVLYLLIRLVWWCYRTIPYRVRVWATKLRTRRWRRRVPKIWKPRFFSPEIRIQELERFRQEQHSSRVTGAPS